MRCFLQFSQNELPKRAFRAMLPTIFTEKASKRIVSCEASSKFHRRSFQNERFVRGLLQISQNHASKTSVSHDASDNFGRKSFQNDRFVRGFFQISQNKLPKRAFRAMLPTIFTKNLRFATVSRNRHTASCERVHPPKAKLCLALQRRAFPNFKMYVSLQRRAQKCMNLSTVNRPASRTQKSEVLLQFWAIDTTFLLRGFTASK